MREIPVNPIAKELLYTLCDKKLSGRLYLMCILILEEVEDENKEMREIINLIRSYETEEEILQKMEEKYSDIWSTL
ncbi:MAG: hypothetical protein IKV52_00330 [Oscillospiraceae bacterium]|nr:hypothetical protein [Oscillospiraceae bacterium]